MKFKIDTRHVPRFSNRDDVTVSQPTTTEVLFVPALRGPRYVLRCTDIPNFDAVHNNFYR